MIFIGIGPVLTFTLIWVLLTVVVGSVTGTEQSAVHGRPRLDPRSSWSLFRIGVSRFITFTLGESDALESHADTHHRPVRLG